MNIKTANTILYCKKWEETLVFYRDRLCLEISLSKAWFVEFILNKDARLSIANENKTTIPSAGGQGITLSFEVPSIEDSHSHMQKSGLAPSPIRNHPWHARVFYLYDPEGNRLEFWMSCPQ
ncbi:MAG: VOC family protein [Proteobacteria bacterium]|nr:VOC family protein [Pseudomonadota bacterium]